MKKFKLFYYWVRTAAALWRFERCVTKCRRLGHRVVKFNKKFEDLV